MGRGKGAYCAGPGGLRKNNEKIDPLSDAFQSMLHRPPVFKEAAATPATAFLAPGAPTPLSQALRPPPLHIERPEGGPPTMDAALINLCTLEA